MKKLLVVLATLMLCGCVNGTPFEPEMCEVTVNKEGVIVISAEMLELCALPRFRTTITR